MGNSQWEYIDETLMPELKEQAKRLLEELKDKVAEEGGKLILAVFSGSIAYGRYNRNSDLDLRGIYLPSKETYLLAQSPKAIELKDGDVLVQPLPQYFKLAAAGNPNLLEWLFVRNDHILYCDEKLGRPILENRHLFLSKKMIASFRGYARGSRKELKRLIGNTPLPDSEQLYKMNKHARHITRLLSQLEQALADMTFSTWNPDDRIALDFKNGQLKIREDFLREIDLLTESIQSLSETTALLETPDYQKLDALQMRIAYDWITDSK